MYQPIGKHVMSLDLYNEHIIQITTKGNIDLMYRSTGMYAYYDYTSFSVTTLNLKIHKNMLSWMFTNTIDSVTI